jgi:hypothetical protein
MPVSRHPIEQLFKRLPIEHVVKGQLNLQLGFMDYTIYPFEGLGAIRFGMTSQQVREVGGEPNSTFMKSDKFPSDDYFDLGFHIHYDESGLCEAVEISSPYDEGDLFGLDYTEEPGDCTTLNFQGQVFFKQTFTELKTWFQSLGTDVQHGRTGVTFIKFGITMSSGYYSFRQKVYIYVITMQ